MKGCRVIWQPARFGSERCLCAGSSPVAPTKIFFKVIIMGFKLTKEEVQKRIDLTFKERVKIISNYKNTSEPIELLCEDCGHQWKSPFRNISSYDTHRCPNCREKEIKTGKWVKCAFCGKEIYRSKEKYSRNETGYFYCSYDCGNKHKNQIRKENGEWDDSKNYRKIAFEAYPHYCAVCGWNEDERILEVHHKDENHSNHELQNLCILCPTCHRKITLGYYELTKEYKLINKK